MATQQMKLLSRRCVPNSHGTVVTPADDPLPVWAHRQVRDKIRMSAQGKAQSATSRIPHLYRIKARIPFFCGSSPGFVVTRSAATDDPPSIWAKDHLMGVP